MIKEWIHSYNLSRIVKELPFYMGRDIQPKDRYSKKQIIRIFNKYKFNINYLNYAFALLSDETAFNEMFDNPNTYTFQTLHKEIALKYFNSNSHYNFNDLMHITKFKGQVFSYDGSGENHKGSSWGFTDHSGSGGDGGGSDS